MIVKQQMVIEDFPIDSLVSVLEHSDLSQVEGRILTIIDASFTDRQQREAVKSLVRVALWDWASSLPLHEKALIGQNYNKKN